MSSEHIAASVELDHEGKTYRMSPLDLRDLRELEEWFQRQPIERVKPSLEGLPPHLQRSLLGKAMREGQRIRMGTHAFNVQAQSVSGMERMLYLSLRKNHPDISPEMAASMLTERNLEEIIGSVNRMAGFRPRKKSAAVTKAVEATVKSISRRTGGKSTGR